MTAHSLSFQTTQFDAVDRNGHPWLRSNQIGLALEYKNPELSINKLYRANSDEFTDVMTALVELETNGGKQKVRIFSLRGAHLLAMFARTKVAKEFRKWVLDILDKEVSKVSTPTHTYETLERKDMDNIARIVWLICHNMFHERSWSQAVYYRLRQVTGCPAQNRFRVDHLPVIVQELRRIYTLARDLKDTYQKVEQQVAKRVLRGNENESNVLSEMNQLFQDLLAKNETEMETSLKKWEEHDFINLTQRNGLKITFHLEGYYEPTTSVR